MKAKDVIKGLQDRKVRMVWDEEGEQWYLAVMDVIRMLTESKHPRAYWQGLRRRLMREGYTLKGLRKMALADVVGKRRRVTVMSLEQFFRIVQSVRTPQAEVWREWLAQAGEEEVREAYDPERGLERTLENWRRMGRDESWVVQRILSQGARSRLTRYWGSHGIRDSDEFRALTNVIHEGWSQLTVQEHKEMKGLRTQNLRDHMTEAELIFLTLAEMAARQIAESRRAEGFEANVLSVQQGAGIAGQAREELERYAGKKVVTGENFKERVLKGDRMRSSNRK